MSELDEGEVLTLSAGSLAVDVSVEAGGWRRLGDVPGLVERALQAAAAEVDLPADSELSLVLTDDARMRVLNSAWRGKDTATNVLSFPSGEKSPLLGDVVIAYETLVREAAAEGKSPADCFVHLLVHGLLHLLGLDHDEADEAEIMERLETDILARLGIADPYAEPEPETAVAEAGPDAR